MSAFTDIRTINMGGDKPFAEPEPYQWLEAAYGIARTLEQQGVNANDWPLMGAARSIATMIALAYHDMIDLYDAADCAREQTKREAAAGKMAA
jgi:hypothetical protein